MLHKVSQLEATNTRSFRFKLFLYGFLGAAILLLIAGLAAPTVIRSAKKPDQTEAISNLRQIGLALFEFEAEYRSFPSEATVAEVSKRHPKHGLDLTGTSSNALFRQLFAVQITQSEQMFYAKAYGASKPDGNITSGHLLEKGEVGFGYITIPGISTESDPTLPLAFAPINPGTRKFDPKAFKGKAAILLTDNSARTLDINEDGHAIYQGYNILSPTHPIWKGRTPTIHYPELDPPPAPNFFQKIFH